MSSHLHELDLDQCHVWLSLLVKPAGPCMQLFYASGCLTCKRHERVATQSRSPIESETSAWTPFCKLTAVLVKRVCYVIAWLGRWWLCVSQTADKILRHLVARCRAFERDLLVSAPSCFWQSHTGRRHQPERPEALSSSSPSDPISPGGLREPLGSSTMAPGLPALPGSGMPGRSGCFAAGGFLRF